MPIYAFTCARCGDFDVVRTVADAAAPATCPACGTAARRVFSPPGLRLLAKPLRGALDREEKSAHEPEVARTKQGRPMPHGHSPTPPWVLSH
ncbi:MAG TPA: FmdB family zinc ribbon protein [Solirubrobacteraceae bacterium]|nr:FmdB family zinc ribbon protein [Solirubrobacteraceae bacterium]